MKKKMPLIIGITSFIVGFAVAVLTWISTDPYAFSSCGRKETERKDITSINVEILSENGDTVYSCGGDWGSVSLKPDTDYTIKIQSPAYRYGNPNGMVDFGYFLLNYVDIAVSFDVGSMSIDEREQEDEKVSHDNWSGYYTLQYTLRGSECTDKTIGVNYSSEFKSKYEGFEFTPCSFKVSFA